MAGTNTATLTFCIEPGLKEALHAVGEQEHSAIATMAEVMIRHYCVRAGFYIPHSRRIAVTDTRPNRGP